MKKTKTLTFVLHRETIRALTLQPGLIGGGAKNPEPSVTCHANGCPGPSDAEIHCHTDP
jgi:hypothetical protein